MKLDEAKIQEKVTAGLTRAQAEDIVRQDEQLRRESIRAEVALIPQRIESANRSVERAKQHLAQVEQEAEKTKALLTELEALEAEEAKLNAKIIEDVFGIKEGSTDTGSEGSADTGAEGGTDTGAEGSADTGAETPAAPTAEPKPKKAKK